MAQYGSIGTDTQVNETVATNLQTIKTNWQQLEKLRKLLGSDRDNKALRKQIQILEAQTNGKIKATDADINRMKASLKHDDKLHRRRLSRFAGDFKNILEKYSECRAAIAIQKRENTLPEEPDAEEVPAPEPSQAEKQQLVIDTSHLEIALLEGREENMRQLEVDIVDLNSIIIEMAAMTDEQDKQITEIHNDVEATLDNVEDGATQLAKAGRSATQRRKCYLVLIIIAVILLIVVLYFLLAK